METYSSRLVEMLRVHAEVDVIALPGRHGGAAPATAALISFGLTTALRLLVAKPRDITHVGDMASWPFALIARLRSRQTRIALSAHGTDVSLPRRGGTIAGLYQLYLRLGARLLPAAVVIANSAATADEAKAAGYTNVAVVPLATDIPVAPAPQPNGTTLLFVGRLTQRKGCAWFVRNVLPLLPQATTMQVIGTVWDDDERAALNDPRVSFVGPVFGAALAREYAGALCVVVPTRDFEGFGLTAIESAASGGVVLVSGHSGLAEAVIDGVTGFHLPPDDAVAWAQKIQEIQAWSDERRHAFIANAIATTRRHFSWERVARDTLAAYSQAELPRPVARPVDSRVAR